MKCPECNGTFSDLRDICPSCKLDLRAFKQSVGLPVAHPMAAYEELLTKMPRSKIEGGTQPDPSVRPSGGFLSWVGSVLEGVAPAAPSSETKLSSPAEASASPQSSQEASVDDGGFIDDTLLQQAVADESSAQSPADDTDNAELTIDFSDAIEPSFEAARDPESQAITAEFDLSKDVDQLDEIIDRLFEKSGLVISEEPSPYAESADIESLITEEIPDPSPEPAPPIPDQPIPPEPAPPVIQAAPPLEDIPALFEESLQEMASDDARTTVEMGADTFAAVSRSEEIDVLFELAEQELQNPGAYERYTEKLVASDEREVEAAAIQQQLAAVEQVVDAPLPSLKAMQSELSLEQTTSAALARSFDEEAAEALRHPATPVQRAVAAAIDLGVVFLLAAMLSAIIVFHFNPDFLRETSPQFDRLGWLAFLSFLIPLGLIGLMLYPLACEPLFSATAGARIARLRIVRDDGKPLRPDGAIVRALLFPISLLCGGAFPAFFGRRTLHDKVARTAVVHARPL